MWKILKSTIEPMGKRYIVIYLRISSDLSFAEIGEIIGKSENCARVTFYRAKKKLMEGD
ncbi:hypothetical protein [Clostridium sp.]|uniref:hypothetical protein n=1 Tax=Clostridium sp. TaxID=1506 RepID=UPI00321804C5